MSDFRSIVERFKGKRVVVFGDLVADVFVYGEISRISREAPVLILNHRQTQVVPGGGANAIHNLWALGAKPVPVGMVGDDSEGQQLVGFFSRLGIDVSGINVAKSYRTPTKMRILAGAVHSQRQQIVRIDSGGPIEEDKSRDGIEQKLKIALNDADGFLVSDYGYSLVTPYLVSKVRKDSIPATIDSRFSMMEFSKMTAATPNEPEVEAALGISIGNDASKLEWAGRTLLRKLQHDALLITRGKDGMALFERGKKTIHIPIHGTDEIADVTGAGDTVIATFTLALAAGASHYDAARLANYAGGIVVMKYGTRPVMYDELVKALAEENEDAV
ncbi:MAG TPA: PfkB family carbohydrate kinase [Terriglobia bacterium]|nr:PfkB family carbohydrate kinase [Terriglobia bacterium]